MGHNSINPKSLELLVVGKLQNKPAEVADALNNYFVDSVENIIKYFTPEYKNTVCQVKQTEPASNIVSITESDVMRVIRSLRPSRAKDVIGMNTCMLKDLSKVLVNPITKFFNFSFTNRMFPNDVIPVFKGGNRLSTSNYRPVSILPVVSKVAEKLVAEQIINHLNTFK